MNQRTMPGGFGGLEFADQTAIHPLAALIAILCVIAVMFSKPRNMIWPFLILTCFISSAQRISILTIDFKLLRILILFGLVRVLLRKEHLNFVRHPLDRLVTAFWVSKLLIHTFQTGDSATFVFELGGMIDALGIYFIFRAALNTWEDVLTTLKAIACVALPVGIFFISEYATGRNLFSIFGGVSEYTMIRGGRLRCQGSFSHPILAGAFWASMLPLIYAQAKISIDKRAIYWLAAFSSIWIVFASSSSTPVFGVGAAIVGALFFPFRAHMRSVRWITFLVLVTLHLVMHAPVWHLISRVSAVGGSTSYFRYQLLNQFILRVDEWWFLGTQSTAHWFWGAQDLTNQYILEGVRGGFLTLALFIAVIAVSFRSVGRSLRRVGDDTKKLTIIWSVGVTLFTHCAMFLGVSYFGYIIFAWYLTLAIIASLDGITEKGDMQNQNRES